MNRPFAKTKKTYDKFYLKENRKKTPKEYFKFINEYLSKFVRSRKKPSLLDIGCATGDFLHYLRGLYPQARLYGVDVLPEMIKRAKKEVPSAEFIRADIFSGKNLPNAKFDFVFMSGVHPDFDEFTPWINNLLKLVKKRGKIFVFGIFNYNDVDTLMRTRFSKKGSKWQPGWNLFSKKTIGDYLTSRKIKYKFHDFNIQIDIPKHKGDPLRSWTVKLEDGSRMIINGAGIIYYLSLLIIER